MDLYNKENIVKVKDTSMIKGANNLPDHVLTCAKFQEPLVIDSGEIISGKLKTWNFLLRNPSETKSVKLSVQKPDRQNGVYVELGHECQNQIEIPPSSHVPGLIYLHPTSLGNVREVINLKLDERATLQIKIFGQVVPEKLPPKSQLSTSLVVKNEDFVSLGSSSTRKSLLDRSLAMKSKIPTLRSGSKDQTTSSTNAKTALTLSQPSAARQPIATDNSEYWISQQAKTLTEWLNQKFATSTINSASSSSSSPVDDNESMNYSFSCDYVNNLHLLLEKDEKERVFSQGRKILLSNEIQSVLSLVYKEIDSNRLMIRDDRNIHLDIGLQEGMLELLFSFHEDYLKFGLEIIFNKPIQFPKSLSSFCSTGAQTPETNSDLMKIRKILRTFIQNNLFAYEINAELMKGLSHKDSEKLKKTMICTHIMKKFIELIYFLDHIRLKMLLINQRMLFQKTSKSGIKTSKELIIQFCQLCLKGEGDIVKHLGTLGYKLSFEQKPIDEYDFHIPSSDTLFQSLKDGVRFARLFEVLSKNQAEDGNDDDHHRHSPEIMNQLRVPAGSILQKKHNLSLVFETAFGKQHGIDIDTIIDGNNTKFKQYMLMILWKFMYTFELQMMINSTTVYHEIERINQRVSLLKKNDPSDNGGQLVPSHNIEQVLLLWCQTIANQYFGNHPVHNLSLHELLDGKIINVIMYYYHPNIFPKTFSQTLFAATEEGEETEVVKAQRKKRLLKYFVHACRNLGGIPNIFYKLFSEAEFMKSHYNNSSNNGAGTPQDQHADDKKTILLFLSYLFLRLVESSKQMKAVIVIQRAYRQFKHFTFLRKVANSKKGKNQTNGNSSISSADTIQPHEDTAASVPFSPPPKVGLSVQARFVKPPVTTNDGSFSPEITVMIPKNPKPAHLEAKELMESFDALDLSHLIVESVESIDSYYVEQHFLENQSHLGPMPSTILEDPVLEQEEEELDKVNLNDDIVEIIVNTPFKPESNSSSAHSSIKKDLQATAANLSSQKEILGEEEVDLSTSLDASNVGLEDLLLSKFQPTVTRLSFDDGIEEIEEIQNTSIHLYEEKLVENQLQHALATVLQRHIRGYLKRQSYNRMYESTLCIQTNYRSYSCRKVFLTKRLVVLILQSMWRRKRMYYYVLKMEAATNKIIRCYRNYKTAQRRNYQKRLEMNAILFIQKTIRDYNIYRSYLTHKQMKIAEKKKNSFLNALKLKLFSHTLIQLWRKYQMKKNGELVEQQELQKEMKLAESKKQQSSKVIRSFVVQRMTASKEKKLIFVSLQRISKLVKCYLMKSNLKKFLTRLRSFSALRRGYSIRKQFYSKKASPLQKQLLKLLTNLRAHQEDLHLFQLSEEEANGAHNLEMSQLNIASLENSNSNRKGLTLHTKAKNALNLLHHGKMISHYMKGCQYLVNYTNYCKEICELFVYTNSSGVLFRLLQTCNRSTPHQELLK
jgi:hypothetical protein